jgi:hypothetical protein
MTLSPAARHWLDRALLYGTAIAILAVAFTFSERVAGKQEGAQLVVRLILLAFVLANMAPWLRRSASWLKHKYRAMRAAALTRSTSTTSTARGFRRIDAYVIAGLLLLAAFIIAEGRRYSVTHYREGTSLVYQRTDTWTGKTELWVVNREQRRRLFINQPESRPADLGTAFGAGVYDFTWPKWVTITTGQ